MTSFSFNQENNLKISGLLKKYPENCKASAVLPVLDLAQRQNNGWLSQAAIAEVAMILDMPEIRVFEVASFYTMFNLKPIGKYHVQVCGTTPCMLRGAEDVVKACKEQLNISFGQTTKDGMFTLSEVECLGACVSAPVMQINDDFFENLTPETTKQILNDLKSKNTSKCNSEIAKKHAETEGC